VSTHYYLISSLPYLERMGVPPISSETYLGMCEGQVSTAEFEALATLDLVPREQPCCDAEARWNAAETAIRNTLVKHRAGRMQNAAGIESMRPWVDRYTGLEEQAAATLEAGNPLAVSQAIDALRWQVLDDIEAAGQFTFDTLVVYRLKLMILEKWEPLNHEKGMRELNLLIESKLKSLNIPELANG